MDDLPDAIIISIISLLPLREAVRTNVLANRWSGLWRFISRVDLDMGVIIKQCKQCDNEVQNLQTTLPSPHLIFHLTSSMDKIASNLQCAITWCRIILPGFAQYNVELKNWVKTLINGRCVQELTLVWKPSANMTNDEKIKLLPGMFSGGTLRILNLTNFRLRNASDLDGCTNLRTLKLESVCLTDKVLDEINQWESLENLSISTSDSPVTDLKICGPKLKYLRLKGFKKLVNIDIRVPNLDVLMLEDILIPGYAGPIWIDTPNLTNFHADSVNALTSTNTVEFIDGWKLLENLRLSDCSKIMRLKFCHHNLKTLELQKLPLVEFDIDAEKLWSLAFDNIEWLINCISLTSPNLQVFHVRQDSYFSDEHFDQIIRGSKLLKDVVIQCCSQLKQVNICSQNLEILQLQALTLNKIKICAEELHVLEIANVSCQIEDTVINVPNLIDLHLYSTPQENRINRLLPVDFLENQSSIFDSQPGRFDHQLGCDHLWCPLILKSLQTLSISLDLNNIGDNNILSSVLKSCTYLETLDIFIQENNVILDTNVNRASWANRDYKFWDEERMSTSRGINYNYLKTVEIHGYQNKALEFEFYKHIMVKSKNLERISIRFFDKISQDDVYTSSKLFLQLQRPSPNVSINFISYDGNHTVTAPSHRF